MPPRPLTGARAREHDRAYWRRHMCRGARELENKAMTTAERIIDNQPQIHRALVRRPAASGQPPAASRQRPAASTERRRRVRRGYSAGLDARHTHAGGLKLRTPPASCRANFDGLTSEARRRGPRAESDRAYSSFWYAIYATQCERQYAKCASARHVSECLCVWPYGTWMDSRALRALERALLALE
ncbi:hypothetical protein CC85DRAFT_146130 [Cutaneotrichosporon oleaginosum]|uniref:Uncharacterized protein n=1 Tax=Cutaneotrichosporon oleaginosum TaxID=879819 RepID=A0A0J0XHX0_9TREE|nr:uncharacterized protein CC85DRAFT_146130 [Cutaneotrichosporon oleaginosum]KLT40673.1 hypothetical protein CC85DRAFT_146130 [Cutaneotrichosporon oleaginosum]TXT12483.1 hypothetical protein COLE_02893 [Cutaneotrichosporon oleaginosum]